MKNKQQNAPINREKRHELPLIHECTRECLIYSYLIDLHAPSHNGPICSGKPVGPGLGQEQNARLIGITNT